MYKQIVTSTLAILIVPFLIKPVPISDHRDLRLVEPIKVSIEERKPLELLKEPPETNLTVSKPSTPSGSWIDQCKEWASQAGITLSENAIKLIEKESHCNPNSQNKHSTAYGIGQFLNSTWGLKGVGCKKTSDPVQQLRCMDRYVKSVRGGWDSAWAYWLNHKSY